MIYKKSFSLEIYGKWREFKQVTKPTAAKLFNDGKLILLQSSNMPVNSFWQSPCPILKGKSWTDDFEEHCNSFKYYNCDSERGKYIRFFVEI